MTTPPRKPSDDSLFWFAYRLSDELGRFLFDVLALVMSELQQTDEQDLPTTFQQFREMAYRHVDELAKESKLSGRYRSVDAQILKVKMDLFLGVERC